MSPRLWVRVPNAPTRTPHHRYNVARPTPCPDEGEPLITKRLFWRIRFLYPYCNAESLSVNSRPYVKGNFTHCVDQVTDKIPNSPAQGNARRQVSPLSTIRLWCALALHRLAALAPGRRKFAALSARQYVPPPSLPTRPGSPIQTDFRSRGPLTTGKHGRRWIGEKFKNIADRLRRASFAQHHATTAD
jgi:hypothetical protein